MLSGTFFFSLDVAYTIYNSAFDKRKWAYVYVNVYGILRFGSLSLSAAFALDQDEDCSLTVYALNVS